MLKEMKTKLITAACALAISLGGISSAYASDESDPVLVVADAVVVRPACFVATAVGTAFFVISLPIAAISGSIHKTARVLVVKPAKATFTRELGDMDALMD